LLIIQACNRSVLVELMRVISVDIKVSLHPLDHRPRIKAITFWQSQVTQHDRD